MYDLAMSRYAAAFCVPAFGSRMTLWKSGMALSYWPFLNWSMPSFRSDPGPDDWANPCKEPSTRAQSRIGRIAFRGCDIGLLFSSLDFRPANPQTERHSTICGNGMLLPKPLH